MLAPLLVSLAVVASASPPVTRISARERTSALVLVTLPRGSAPHVPTTELVRGATAAFRARTGLDLREAEALGLDADLPSRCERAARMSCWIDALTPRTPTAPRAAITAMFVVGVLPLGDGRDRITSTLVDVARAAECAREGGEGDEVIEDCIWERSARTEPAVLASDSPDDVARFFTTHVDGALAPLLEALGERTPFGRVELSTTEPDVELELDGAPAGNLAAGTTVIEDVRPGRRTLTFSRAGFTSRVVTIHVARAHTSTAAVSLVPLTAPEGPRPDRVVFWAGAATTLAGVIFGTYAIARATSVTTTCLVVRPDAPCETVGAPTFSAPSDELPSFDHTRVSPAGISVPAVAIGLTAAGATWMTAPLFDDDGVPWLPILLGVGAGVAGATITAWVEP